MRQAAGYLNHSTKHNPPSLELRRVLLAIHPGSKLPGILAKSNKNILYF
jgi:hypothetical protein